MKQIKNHHHKVFYLIEMRPKWFSEVKLLFLSEPAELRLYHSLLSAERRQVEEVKPFSSMTCRRKTPNIPLMKHLISVFMNTCIKVFKIGCSTGLLAARNGAQLRVWITITHCNPWHWMLLYGLIFFQSTFLGTCQCYSPLSSKLRTMFPSKISFWLFGRPSETVTALNRSNINWGAFLCGATAGPRGKSFRWNNASSFSLTVLVASNPPCRPEVPLSSGMASSVTHLSWTARTSQRRRAPVVIFSESGLSCGAVGRWVIRATPLPLITGCPCIQLTPGDDWAVIDGDDGGNTQRKGENDPRVSYKDKK